MTKEVVVTISGLQLSDGDQDTIETVHVGEYHEKDGVKSFLQTQHQWRTLLGL